MTEVFVVESESERLNFELVGVYSTFDKAVGGADVHKAWKNRGGYYHITCLCIDENYTQEIFRYKTFELSRGQVPSWFLRETKYKERFEK